MIGTYLRLAVWPDPDADYGPTVPIRLHDGVALSRLMIVIGLVIVAWRTSPPLAYLGTWFFVTLAPTSSVVPIASRGWCRAPDVPAAGRLIVFGVLAASDEWCGRSGRLAAAWPAIDRDGGLRGRDAVRGDHRTKSGLHDRLRLWESVVAHRPHGRAHHNVAVELAARGRTEEAMAHYRLATTEAPEAHYALGFELGQRGRVDEAMVELRQSIVRKPDDVLLPRAYTLLGFLLSQRGDSEGAVGRLSHYLGDAAGRRRCARRPGRRLGALGRLDDAERADRAYLKSQPANPVADTNLGVLLSEQDWHAEAVASFARSVDLGRRNLRLNLGLALMWREDRRRGAGVPRGSQAEWNSASTRAWHSSGTRRESDAAAVSPRTGRASSPLNRSPATGGPLRRGCTSCRCAAVVTDRARLPRVNTATAARGESQGV